MCLLGHAFSNGLRGRGKVCKLANAKTCNRQTPATGHAFLHYILVCLLQWLLGPASFVSSMAACVCFLRRLAGLGRDGERQPGGAGRVVRVRACRPFGVADMHIKRKRRYNRIWKACSADDPEMQTYTSRLRKEDKAQVVRLRWYGPRSDSPDYPIWVEQKVHREPWTGERSFKVSPPLHAVSMLHSNDGG